QLVDLGCNTGVYTLLAARLGRPVLAVDALPANLALLQLALRPALFFDLITSLHNAVYSKRIRMFVDITDEPNLGGMDVKEHTIDHQTRNRSLSLSQAEDSSHRVLVDAVCLDDLVPYVRHDLSVFLKMDIEGAEAHALRCADHFFSALDVRVVQME
ncbi:hypothetical protein EGW08_012922, partial [Elysia chlorotica]